MYIDIAFRHFVFVDLLCTSFFSGTSISPTPWPCGAWAQSKPSGLSYPNPVVSRRLTQTHLNNWLQKDMCCAVPMPVQHRTCMLIQYHGVYGCVSKLDPSRLLFSTTVHHSELISALFPRAPVAERPKFVDNSKIQIMIGGNSTSGVLSAVGSISIRAISISV